MMVAYSAAPCRRAAPAAQKRGRKNSGPTRKSALGADAGSVPLRVRGRAPLSDGDILRMGLHVFRIELQAAAASSDPSARS